MGKKSRNFPVGRTSRTKTFRTERVNRFRDKNTPKLHKLLLRQKCAQIAFAYMPCLSWDTLWELLTLYGNFPDHLETFQTIRKLSRLLGNFEALWKLSTLSRNFPDSPESFKTDRKHSGLSGNIPDYLETLQTVSKPSECKGSFQTVWYILKLIHFFIDVEALFHGQFCN